MADYLILESEYKKSVIDEAEKILRNNGRRIIELLNNAKVKFVEFNDQDWYQNLNIKDDYLTYIRKIEKSRDCYRNSNL